MKTGKNKDDQATNRFAYTNANESLQFTNEEEIKFYVRDLCLKIEALEERLEYVPISSCTLLAKYNTLEHSTTVKDFRISIL